MITNLFPVPIYHVVNAFNKKDLDQIKNRYNFFKERSLLNNFNGTSLLSFNTPSGGASLNNPLMNDIRDKVLFHCLQYINQLGIKIEGMTITKDWVIGYEKDQYQGEHNHGYDNSDISGVIFASVPEGASPLIFITPNPYALHSCVVNESSYGIIPEEGMVVLFPSFLKHKILPNINMEVGHLRLAMSFNIRLQ